MITALGVLGFCFIAYIVISSLIISEDRHTLRGQDEYIVKLEHENERMREGN